MPSVQRFKTDGGEIWVKGEPGEKPEVRVIADGEYLRFEIETWGWVTDKQRAISRALIEAPEKSNRQIARMIGVSHHTTVSNVRGNMESTGEISQLDKTIGADGKSRTTQPARRPISTTAESQADAELSS